MPKGGVLRVGGLRFPSVPVAVLEAALQGRSTVESVGRALGATIVSPMNDGDGADAAAAIMTSDLEAYGFGSAEFSERGKLFVVHLRAPTFRLATLAEAFVAAVLATATGREVGAAAFDENGDWAIAILDPGVAAFLRAKHVRSIDQTLQLLGGHAAS